MAYSGHTIINGPAVIFLILMVVLVYALPRRLAIFPLLFTVLMMTIGQQIVIFSLHFTFMRIVILLGWLRIFIRSEYTELKLNDIDKAFLMWVGVAVIIGFVPKYRDPRAIMPELNFLQTTIRMGGFAFDALGGYFMTRCFIRTTDDIARVVKMMITLGIVIATFMTIEKVTSRNYFSFFGAVPELTRVRDGRLRCQGPFTHPIHAGTFGAILVPLSAGLLRGNITRWALIGAFTGTVITVESASSGPLMTWVFSIVALGFWRYRHNMKAVRRLITFSLIGLEFVMNAHVWWIMARLGSVIGGHGYWRSKLIDQFVFHFSEWWLRGTAYTAHWSPTGVGLPLYPDMMDLTNQFVAEGVHGGILRLGLFIFLIIRGFKRIGEVVKEKRYWPIQDRFLFWSLGATLFSFCVSFLSVSDSSQTGMLYYCLLGLMGAEYPCSESVVVQR